MMGLPFFTFRLANNYPPPHYVVTNAGLVSRMTKQIRGQVVKIGLRDLKPEGSTRAYISDR